MVGRPHLFSHLAYDYADEGCHAFGARLLAINAVSLALALTSNLCLLLNMARRISFSVAQPITIIGWYFASVLLMALVCVTEVHLKFPAGQVRDLTQAFYYAIIAAILYFMIATLMVCTVWGAYRGEYPKEFELTMSQRTLMLQTISYMVYLLGGAAIFAKVERWQFSDAVYWANFTLLTVGIGDFVPVTHIGRSLLFPYGIGGIVILGLVIGSIRSMVLERGKKKLGSRMIEKKRERALKKIHKNGEAKKLTPITSEQKAQELDMSEQERRREEFLLMRKIQKKASQKQKWTALLISSCAWFFLWLMGAFAFYKFEVKQGWTYFQSLYFSYTSLLAIGYGDFSPASNPGKPFFVFWSLLAVPTLTILISNMGDTVIAGIRDLTIYLGEFTVLPGEASIKDRIKQHASKVTKGKAFSNTSGPRMDDPPGFMGVGEKSQDEDQEKGSNNNRLAHAAATDHLAKLLEKEELAEASAAADRGDRLSSDTHMYHFLLIKELRNVMKHVNEKPPKRYSYEEWTWYLKLIGEDESVSSTHRKAPIKVNSNDEKGMIQQVGGGGGGGGGGKQKRQGGDKMDDAAGDDEEETKGWSWVGTRSPLMGEIEEAEWILERLSVTLERELKKQHIERRRERLLGGGGGGEERRKERKKGEGEGSLEG